MRQSGGLPLAAGLDGGDTLITSNPSSSAKKKTTPNGVVFLFVLYAYQFDSAQPLASLLEGGGPL